MNVIAGLKWGNYLLVLAFLVCLLSACHTSIKVVNAETYSWDNIKSGANIKFKAITYNLKEPVLIVGKENITIDGNGATLMMNSLAEDVVKIINSKNITLKNFKATHIEPKGPTGCTGNVIQILDGENILIEKCELNGCGIVGVASYNTKNLKLRNNHIHKNSEYGIIYQGPSIEIEGNTFEDNKKGHLYFSFNDSSWPPKDLINEEQNKEGLKMKQNIFK